MNMQSGNQNYLLPRNENVNNQQASSVKRIIYNDNNLVSQFSFQLNSFLYFILKFVFYIHRLTE